VWATAAALNACCGSEQEGCFGPGGRLGTAPELQRQVGPCYKATSGGA
jgi:hypothetical protein